MIIIRKFLSTLALIGLISGCTVTKDYEAPPIDIPTDWRTPFQELSEKEGADTSSNISIQTAANYADTAWWEQFEDPKLNELISTALNENKDLRIAMARVEEFAARMQSTQADYYPQLAYGGNAYRDQRSLEKATPLSLRSERINSNYNATVGVGWEIDLWGRIKRSNEAAQADFLAVEEGRRAIILSLVSTLVQGYIDLLSLDSQLEISLKTLDARGEWLEHFEIKSRGGQISDLELAQVRAAYEEIAVIIPSLESRIAQQENFISVLLGSNPIAIERENTLQKLTQPEIPQGLPSELLKRRPDILQSEQWLISANARMGVVQTQYYPTISLTGALGYASTELSNLFTGSANFYSFGAGLAGPIFNGGRIKGEIWQAEAQYRQYLNEYLKIIQNAFKEVNDSLIITKKLNEQKAAEKSYLAVLNDYFRYAQSRYDNGYTQYITVLDSQRQLYRAEIFFVETQSRVLKSLVNMYKVMGGGWVEVAQEGMLIHENAKKDPKISTAPLVVY